MKKEILSAARELLADPKRWTRKSLARNRYGEYVYSSSEEACSWCAMGALFREWSRRSQDRYLRNECYDLLNDTARCLAYPGMVELNDNAQHDDVLRMFDLALEKC